MIRVLFEGLPARTARLHARPNPTVAHGMAGPAVRGQWLGLPTRGMPYKPGIHGKSLVTKYPPQGRTQHWQMAARGKQAATRSSLLANQLGTSLASGPSYNQHGGTR